MSERDDVLGRHEASRRAYLLDDLAYDVSLDLGDGRGAVSYTHLTLPTIYSV